MRANRRPDHEKWVSVLAAAFVAASLVCCGGGDDGNTGPSYDGAFNGPGLDATDPDSTAAPPSDAADDTWVRPCECDDQLLCTSDFCDENGACQHSEFAVDSGQTIGQKAPDFTLTDANTESATNGESVTLSEINAGGKVAVLVFHAADCTTCREQGELARSFWATIQSDATVFFASVNTAAAATDIAAYVNADEAAVDGPAGPSTWPVLQDTSTAKVWEAYCADTDWVIVVDRAGFVQYFREFNFGDEPFVAELQARIDSAKTSPGGAP